MNFLLAILFVLKTWAQDTPPDFHKPFWKTKPEVIKRMKDEDLIVVSAKTDKALNVVAGGIVSVPLDVTYKVITDYEKLKNASSRFKEVRFEKATQTLFLHMEALGYHARMHLKLKEQPGLPGSSTKQIHWECVQGQFLGMKGVIQVEAIERQKTEISMTANYVAETLPLPKVLMGIGLEIIGKQVATQMRKYILEQWTGI